MAPSLRAEPEYQFSPVNQSSIATVAAYWNPIVGYVCRRSRASFSLKIGRTSADTTAYVLAQEVDFAFTNHLFSPERDPLGWKVLARRNTPPLHGQIVVPADSPINDIAQLKGLDVGFRPEAFIAYKTTYAEILRRKVDVKVVFGGNMDGALPSSSAARWRPSAPTRSWWRAMPSARASASGAVELGGLP